MKSFLLAAFVTANAMCAVAQPPAPASTETTRHKCVTPVIVLAGRNASEADVIKFVGQLDEYSSCVQAFSRDQQLSAANHQKAAQAALASAKAAVKEYNEFVEAAERATTRR